MLVYDVTNEKSFDNIRNWIRNIEEVNYYLPGECSCIIVILHMGLYVIITAFIL